MRYTSSFTKDDNCPVCSGHVLLVFDEGEVDSIIRRCACPIAAVQTYDGYELTEIDKDEAPFYVQPHNFH